jgi:large subunit ribosomal protein L31
MQTKIHPKYHIPATVTCACGAVLETGSTIETTTVEICSNCHPFYTGKKKVIDSTGRVDRFKKLSEKSSAIQSVKAPKKSRTKKETAATEK